MKARWKAILKRKKSTNWKVAVFFTVVSLSGLHRLQPRNTLASHIWPSKNSWLLVGLLRKIVFQTKNALKWFSNSWLVCCQMKETRNWWKNYYIHPLRIVILKWRVWMSIKTKNLPKNSSGIIRKPFVIQTASWLLRVYQMWTALEYHLCWTLSVN